MITSPHLVSWRERIRVNGRAIPEADLLRILDDLAPEIDAIEATLERTAVFQPAGDFSGDCAALVRRAECQRGGAGSRARRALRRHRRRAEQTGAVHADHARTYGAAWADAGADRLAQSRDHQGARLRLQRPAADRSARSAASRSRRAGRRVRLDRADGHGRIRRQDRQRAC